MGTNMTTKGCVNEYIAYPGMCGAETLDASIDYHKIIRQGFIAMEVMTIDIRNFDGTS